MKLIQEILPFILLVAITLGAKMFENWKNHSRPQSVQPPAPQWTTVSRRDEEDQQPTNPWDDELPADIPRHPEVSEPQPRPMSAMPPVAEIPTTLRGFMEAMSARARISEPVSEPAKLNTLSHRVETRTRVAASVDAVHHAAKPLVDVSIPGVRTGLLWKTILDEPRYKHPWRPVS